MSIGTLLPPAAAADPLAEALAACAAEPVHVPGGVQPFGVLLALGDDDRVAACGGRAEKAFGRPAAAVVGAAVDDLFDPHTAGRLQGAFADIPAGAVRRLGVVPTLAGPDRLYWAKVHAHDGVPIAELIDEAAVARDVPAGPDDVSNVVDELTARMNSDEPAAEFERAVVDQVRTASGYDRVMVYRFAPDGSGQVTAESRAADVADPYLGLHYPASDIPPQARELYLKNRSRVLVDVRADPDPLVPPAHPATGRPLDLTYATLRALSPVHREYLANMGVRATLVASVARRGRLWGLVVCHHRAPRLPSDAVRRLVRSVGQVIAARAGVADERARRRGAEAAQRLLGRLPDCLARAGEFEATLVDPAAGLMELQDADGLAVAHRGRVWARGLTPPGADVRRLAGWLDARPERVFVTDAVGADAPEFAHLAPTACGLMAVRFPTAMPGWVLWFRREQADTVTWAGDPRKELTAGDGPPRLSPRTSFAAWVEEVRGRARPWTAEQVAMIDEVVRPNLTEVLLQVSQRRAARAEQQHRATAEQLRAVFDTATDAILLADTDGRIVSANPAAEALFGRPAADLAERAVWDLMADPAAARRRWADLPRAGRAAGDCRMARADGASVDVDFRAVADVLPGTHLLVLRDVTERKAAEAAVRDSEERFRTLAEAVPAIAYRLDADGLGGFANSRWDEYFGFPLEAAARGNWRATVHPDDHDRVMARWTRCVARGDTYESEHRLVRRDGAARWHLSRAVPLKDAAGRVTGWCGTITDVHDLKMAQQAARQQEAVLRMAAEVAGLGVLAIDYAADTATPDAVAAAQLGLAAGVPVPRAELHARIHPDDRAEVFRRMAAALDSAGDGGFVMEHRVVRPDGTVRWLSVRKRILFDADGGPRRPRSAVVAAADITDRKAAEQAIRDSEQRLALAKDAAGLGIHDWDMSAGVIRWDDRMRELWGVGPDEPVTPDVFLAGVHPDDRAAVQAAIGRATDPIGDCRGGVEYRVVGRDGRVRWVAGSGQVTFAAGRPVRMVGTVQDITDRKDAEAALRDSEERYRLALEAGQLGAFDWDMTTGRVVWSDATFRLFGLPPADPPVVPIEQVADRIHPDDRAEVDRATRAAAAGDGVFRSEHRVVRPDGAVRWVAGFGACRFGPDGRAVRMFGVVQDVTDRKQADARLLQSQKLEALGLLAGGVAHDFNNLLAVVLSQSAELAAALPADSPLRATAAEVHRAGERGADLTRQLMAFGRRQVVQPRVFDLSAKVAEVARLLGRLIGEHIALDVRPDPAAGCVRADPGQVDQVLMNLAVNARDAMPNGGTLTVATAAADLSAGHPALPPGAAPGRYAVLSVSDTGVGMTAEVKARLFEPFFTTKPVGEGTGLGLATAHGIVGRAGGFIAADSRPGRGTRFDVYLPALDVVGVPPPPRPPTPPPVGGEVVLVAEDNPGVRQVIVRLLGLRGYRVLEADGPDAALALIRGGAVPALLITDVVMPGVGGRGLAEAVAAACPGVRVIYLSGYTPDAVLRHGVEQEAVNFLQKPFTADALARLVRRVLDGG